MYKNPGEARPPLAISVDAHVHCLAFTHKTPLLLILSYLYRRQIIANERAPVISGVQPRASAEKSPGGQRKKRPKNSKKDRKNSTIKLLPEGGGQQKKDRK